MGIDLLQFSRRRALYRHAGRGSPVKPGDTMLARIDRIGQMRVCVRAHQPGG
jgi:hypothetical protein